jgi:hypothetical protein
VSRSGKAANRNLVAFGRPRCSGDISQSRGRQVEAGLTVRESTDHAGSAPDLFHDPLQRVVGSDLLPVNVRKAIVGQGLVDRLLDEVCCLGHFACPQVVDDRPCLVVGGLAALLGMNGLEHVAYLANPG